MLRFLKHMLVTLRFSILSIFITLFVVVILIVLAVNYFYTSQTLLITAEKLMHETAVSLTRQFSSEIELAEGDTLLAARLIEDEVLDVSHRTELAAYLVDITKQFYLIQSGFWADEKGSSVIAEYEADDSISTRIIDFTVKPRLQENYHRDIKGNIIKKTISHTVDYDPRTRPWYKQASEAKKMVWTDIYQYKPQPYWGLTVATPVYYPNKKLHGVFGLDLRLDWLSWYLGEQKISPNGLVFVVTTSGKVIAYPDFDTPQNQLVDVHELPRKWIPYSFDRYQKLKNPEFNFSFEGKKYLAVYRPVPHFVEHGWLIGIVVPEDDFTGELKKSIYINASITLAILILGIIFVSTLITKVVKPLKNLVRETEKIKRFDLEERRKVRSRIKEVRSLSNAIYSMKTGLKSFQKYVPAGLVRQLIETGENARIGGARRELAILFTDIKNFTTIAEFMSPDELMEWMCEYFNELSHIIVEEKGTIDKYIGDSIMAFWGAPSPVTDSAACAAQAALRCLQCLNKLNAKWEMQNRHRLETRMGIHMGDVVVGNLGSSERMNYTALGDVINVTSRLEGVNKIYGTQVVVSNEVYDNIKEKFILRMIDCIVMKGKTRADFIYELLAKEKSELAFDVDEYRELFANGFISYQKGNWQDAIATFKKCILIYPGDTVAPVFILRCLQFEKNPPEDWDGVWRVG